MPDESTFTPWGAGWTAPDNMSAEDQWREFVIAWIGLQRPEHVIETGAGAGAITVAIAGALPETSTLTAYEGEPYWRDQAREAVAGSPGVLVAAEETPSPEAFNMADLAILDCDPELRKREMRVWAENARPRTYALIHDVTRRYREEDPERPSMHEELADAVDALGIPWVQTPNPRGGAILRQVTR